MYKNFNITDSEKEQILNRLKDNGYGQPINEQKVIPQQTNNTYPLLKEIVNNLVSGTNVFISKVLPSTIITMNKEKGFKVTNIGHSINFQYFKYSSNINYPYVNYGTITDKDQSKDIQSYASSINKQSPSDLYFDVNNTPSNNHDIAVIYVLMLCRDTTPDIAINILKQLNPNVVQEISNDVFSMANAARRGNSDDPNLYNAEKYLKSLISQKYQKPVDPIQGQPAQPQQKPLNEGQELLKDVFKNIIK
jgi:hypothetical protein